MFHSKRDFLHKIINGLQKTTTLLLNHFSLFGYLCVTQRNRISKFGIVRYFSRYLENRKRKVRMIFQYIHCTNWYPDPQTPSPKSAIPKSQTYKPSKLVNVIVKPKIGIQEGLKKLVVASMSNLHSLCTHRFLVNNLPWSELESFVKLLKNKKFA